MKQHFDYLLDADVDDVSFEFLMHAIERPVSFLRIEKIKELGIDFPQNYRFLEVIQNHDGIIQKDFAEMFHINQSTVTRSLNALENDGFIERVYLNNNKKNKVIRLTDKGNDFIEKMHKFDKTIEKQLFNDFTDDEILKFKKYCFKISKNAVDLVSK